MSGNSSCSSTCSHKSNNGLLIVIVLLQSNRAESGAQIISGGNSDLFSNRKERGSELVISRITLVLGMAFFLISFVMEFI